VDRRVFEVAVGSDGWKNFGMDSPTATTERMNEQRGDRAEFEIGGVEVGARLRHRRLALGALVIFLADRDAAPVFHANRFDDSHQSVGDGPVDLRQVPVLNLAVRLGVNTHNVGGGSIWPLEQIEAALRRPVSMGSPFVLTGLVSGMHPPKLVSRKRGTPPHLTL